MPFLVAGFDVHEQYWKTTPESVVQTSEQGVVERGYIWLVWAYMVEGESPNVTLNI